MLTCQPVADSQFLTQFLVLRDVIPWMLALHEQILAIHPFSTISARHEAGCNVSVRS